MHVSLSLSLSLSHTHTHTHTYSHMDIHIHIQRDNTVSLLERRAGGKCSICERTTLGLAAGRDSNQNCSIGEAAHIYAASKGGPRFEMPQDCTFERNSAKNRIWLCRTCHGIIDRREDKYTADVLMSIKDVAGKKAQMAMVDCTEEV